MPLLDGSARGSMFISLRRTFGFGAALPPVKVVPLPHAVWNNLSRKVAQASLRSDVDGKKLRSHLGGRSSYPSTMLPEEVDGSIGLPSESVAALQQSSVQPFTIHLYFTTAISALETLDRVCLRVASGHGQRCQDQRLRVP